MFRFSLRELVLLVAFVAISCAALKYAGEIWLALISAGAFLTFMTAAVMLIIERGQRQAMASGFVLWMGVYLGLLFFYPVRSDLPTETVLRPIHGLVATDTWLDNITGEVIPDYDPEKPSRRAIQRRVPDYRRFMNIGHVLWTLLLGYVGSRLAGWLYLRRAAGPSASGTTTL